MSARRLAVLATLVAATLATGSAVEAKGAAEVTIRGLGLDRPIVIGPAGSAAVMSTVAEQARFYEAAFDAPLGGALAFAGGDRASSDDLGPRLRMAWAMFHGDGPPGEDVPIFQDLYLYADGGPLVFTPAGQEIYGEPLGNGWHRADEALVGTLQELGVPAEADLRAARAPARWWQAAR